MFFIMENYSAAPTGRASTGEVKIWFKKHTKGTGALIYPVTQLQWYCKAQKNIGDNEVLPKKIAFDLALVSMFFRFLFVFLPVFLFLCIRITTQPEDKQC